jgi:hypothetical protein
MEPVTMGPEPTEPEQRGHWEKTVAIVGEAGFLAPGETCGDRSERNWLATRWESIHAVARQRDDDRGAARAPTPSSELLWPDEPDLDRGVDDGFGL